MRVYEYVIQIILLVGIFKIYFQEGEKAKVYFTKIISPESLVNLYDKLGVTLTGNIALKVHSGEPNGPYFLRPSFLKKIYEHVGGTFVETNTAYSGGRSNTENHINSATINGWLGNTLKFQILDEHPEKDFEIPISTYTKISKNIVGEHLIEYNSCLVLSHLKGHGMGGFGGAMKQLSIGYASRAGKAFIHSAGISSDATQFYSISTNQADFIKSMGDAASSIVKFFREQNFGGIAFINVMVNISLSCDCAGKSAPTPEIDDIGILASVDPVAIDQASLDLIKKSNDGKGKTKWLSQLERLLGEDITSIGEFLGIGTKKYELIDIDSKVKENTVVYQCSKIMKNTIYLTLTFLLMVL